MSIQPMTEEQLDRYAELAIVADHEGMKVSPAVVTVLVDEVRRLQQQRRFLMRAIAKRDAESGSADAALREFLNPDLGDASDEDPDDGESDDEIPNPPYDPPAGTTWREWHGG